MFKSIISMMLAIVLFVSVASGLEQKMDLGQMKLTSHQRFSLQKLKMRLRLCQPRVCNKCVKIIHSAYAAPKLVSSQSEVFRRIFFMSKYYVCDVSFL